MTWIRIIAALALTIAACQHRKSHGGSKVNDGVCVCTCPGELCLRDDLKEGKGSCVWGPSRADIVAAGGCERVPFIPQSRPSNWPKYKYLCGVLDPANPSAAPKIGTLTCR